MLSNRILTIDLFGGTRKGLVDRGCPLEEVLPPLLCNMTVDKVLSNLTNASYLTIGFANDIATRISGPCENTLSFLMDRAFRIVQGWCSWTSFSVNLQKARLLLFTKKYTNTMKHLGVILDVKLNWKNHVEERIHKATKVFWQCRKPFGK